MNENITIGVVEEYKEIRKSGVCNMFDFSRVHSYADQVGYYHLANLDRKDYEYVLNNLSELMLKFGMRCE